MDHPWTWKTVWGLTVGVGGGLGGRGQRGKNRDNCNRIKIIENKKRLSEASLHGALHYCDQPFNVHLGS